MPRARLTKSALDALPTPAKEQVYWDETLPGFGVKVTPAGRKVFIVLYRRPGQVRGCASTRSDRTDGSRLWSLVARLSAFWRPGPRVGIPHPKSARRAG